MEPIHLYNTLTHDVQPFTPREDDAGGGAPRPFAIYTCGPTVYNRVHVGNSGTASDPVCYAGQGQGSIVLPFTPTELRVFTPRLELGLLSVFVIQTATTDTDNLLGVLTTVKPDFKSRVFDMRRILPPFWKTGPRSMEQLPPV